MPRVTCGDLARSAFRPVGGHRTRHEVRLVSAAHRLDGIEDLAAGGVGLTDRDGVGGGDFACGRAEAPGGGALESGLIALSWVVTRNHYGGVLHAGTTDSGSTKPGAETGRLGHGENRQAGASRSAANTLENLDASMYNSGLRRLRWDTSSPAARRTARARETRRWSRGCSAFVEPERVNEHETDDVARLGAGVGDDGAA